LAQEVLAENPFSGARADLEAIAARIVPLAADHERRDEASPVEFVALFDGLDWTRVQTTKAIPPPTVVV